MVEIDLIGFVGLRIVHGLRKGGQSGGNEGCQKRL
jgi:hypothetical protein